MPLSAGDKLGPYEILAPLGIEQGALVMELVEGADLKGGVELDDVANGKQLWGEIREAQDRLRDGSLFLGGALVCHRRRSCSTAKR